MELPREQIGRNKARHTPIPIIKRMNIAKQIVENSDAIEQGHLLLMQQSKRLLHIAHDLLLGIAAAMNRLLRRRYDVHRALAEQRPVGKVRRIRTADFVGDEGVKECTQIGGRPESNFLSLENPRVFVDDAPQTHPQAICRRSLHRRTNLALRTVHALDRVGRENLLHEAGVQELIDSCCRYVCNMPEECREVASDCLLQERKLLRIAVKCRVGLRSTIFLQDKIEMARHRARTAALMLRTPLMLIPPIEMGERFISHVTHLQKTPNFYI